MKRISKEAKRELKKLISGIRRLDKYQEWKHKILKRDIPSYPKLPKKIQVHHLVNITQLVYMYKIKTVRDAIKCKDLWNAPGITLKRGEHFIMTKLGRYKYLTKGFRYLIEQWLSETFTDKLDANKKKKIRRSR